MPEQRRGYPEPVLTSPSIVRLGRRLPLIVFILLAILCLLVIGFACACFSDHPAQAIDRAVSAPAATPAVIEVWSFVILSLIEAPLVLTRRVGGFGRASPAQLRAGRRSAQRAARVRPGPALSTRRQRPA